jgi:hypothetical protein
MTPTRDHKLPTLTEVIEIIERTVENASPIPLAPETVALELEDGDDARDVGPVRPPRSLHDMLTEALLELLEPRLEVWLQAHIDAAARAITQDLRAELPELLRQALNEARSDKPRR